MYLLTKFTIVRQRHETRLTLFTEQQFLFERNVGNKCFSLTGITHAEIPSTV